jgi:hypothetical protein
MLALPLRPGPQCKTMLPWLIETDTAAFDPEATASEPVVVDLWRHGVGHAG